LEILEAHSLIKQKWRGIIILQIILLTNLLELAVGQYFGGIEVVYFTISSGYFEDLIELKHFEPISRGVANKMQLTLEFLACPQAFHLGLD